MQQYKDLLQKILDNGTVRNDRTGTGTIATFGEMLEFDLREGFPAVTTKYTWMKGVWVELLWFLMGTPDATYMTENGVGIWDEWLDENNELGRVYGVQWRQWRKAVEDPETKQVVIEYVDQIKNLIRNIVEDPHSRRHLYIAWNPGELDKMALPPCHLLEQLYVDGEHLDMLAYQRSADTFLGLPFDIASKATMLHMFAAITGKKPRMLKVVLGDTHIYSNHLEQVHTLLQRDPLPLPTLWINPEKKDIDDFVLEDFKLIDYVHQGKLKGAVSV